MGEKILFNDREYYDKQSLNGLPVKDLILKHIKQGPVLDIGCGIGQILEILNGKFEAEGFDPSKYAIGIAKRKGLKVMVSTIKKFKPSKKYKTIILSGILSNLYDPKGDFKKVLNWLDYGGRVILIGVNASSPFVKRHHTHIYFPKYLEMKRLIRENNLKVEKCFGAGRLKYFPFLSTVIFYVLKKI